MIPAILKGKLSRQQENMEDVLTSCVFGILRYLPPEQGLFPFLECTKTIGGDGVENLNLGPGASVEYEFWPWMHERVAGGDDDSWCIPCEPDVLLKINPSVGRPIYVLIEAKYRSGKSSDATDDRDDPTDQLAREWDDIVARAQREDAEPYLIYLTTDVGIPADEIDASEKEYQKKRPNGAFRCGWLSWRHLARSIRRQDGLGVDNPCLRDLICLSERLDLRFFDGVTSIEPEELYWRFQPAPQIFNWLDRTPEDITWSFTR